MTKKGKVILTTNDPTGNIHIVTDKTWKHIQVRRAEEGNTICLNEVEEAIREATIIRNTPQPFPAFTFAKSETSGKIRVVTSFDTANLFTGQVTGYVSTAYPIDPSIESAVGQIIWTAPTTNPAGDDSKEEGDK